MFAPPDEVVESQFLDFIQQVSLAIEVLIECQLLAAGIPCCDKPRRLDVETREENPQAIVLLPDPQYERRFVVYDIVALLVDLP